MWKAIKDVLSSKKAVMTIVSGVTALVSRLGWNVDSETVGLFLAPFIAYIVGQSAVDMKKVAATTEVKPVA